jgi:hypothetical protein
MPLRCLWGIHRPVRRDRLGRLLQPHGVLGQLLGDRERLVCARGRPVVAPGVRGHFGAALLKQR